jgi:hypothetical protein
MDNLQEHFCNVEIREGRNHKKYSPYRELLFEQFHNRDSSIWKLNADLV